MATQSHQLNFVLNLKTQGFKTGVAQITGHVTNLQKIIQKVNQASGTPKGKKPNPNNSWLASLLPPKFLKAVPGPIKALVERLTKLYAVQRTGTFFLEKTIGQWANFYVQMQDIRRETQMTQVDINNFGSQVISISANYGLALNKVANIARFVGQGMNLADKSVAKVAGNLANFADLSGTSEKNAEKFGHFLFRQLKQTEEQAFRTTAAIMGISRATNVSSDMITGILNTQEAQKAMTLAAESVGSKQAVNSIAALTAELVQAGAKEEEITAIISKLGDRSTKLFKIFAAGGFTFDKLREIIAGANVQLERGGLQAAAIGEVWDNLGAGTLKRLNDALQGIKETQTAGNVAAEQQREWIEGFLKQDMSPLQRIQRAFKSFWNDQVEAIDKLVGADFRQWMTDWGFAADIMLEKFRGMTKWLGEKLVPYIDKFKNIVTDTVEGFRAAKELVDRIRGEDTGTQADRKLRLVSGFAEQAVKAGLSHADANALARSKIQSDVNAAGNYSTLTARERVAALQFGIRPQVPKSESPETSKDPAVQILKKQLEETIKLRNEMKEERDKNELRRGLYPDSPVNGGRGRIGSAAVDAARTP